MLQFVFRLARCATSLLLTCLLSFAVPNTAISISTKSVSAPSLGKSLSIRCLVSKTVDGLSASPILQWLNDNGGDIVSGDGVTLDGPNFQSTLTTLTLMFSALHTSHAGRYVCRGSLSSPALFSPLVKTEDYNISVQSEHTTQCFISSKILYIPSYLTMKIKQQK